ncbi:MAG: hypothetical protein NTW73_02600 [Candidatus Parcubacteria bacterium]|nr:hypothetical protein [Candidatus Parcubacteria bacterium]
MMRPIDPNPLITGTNLRYYVYLTNGTSTWELIANLESNYYTSGTENRELSDGGFMTKLYEEGNNLTMVTSASATCFGTDNVN